MKWNIDKALVRLARLLQVDLTEIKIESKFIRYDPTQKDLNSKVFGSEKNLIPGKHYPRWEVAVGRHPLRFYGVDIFQACLRARKWSRSLEKDISKAKKRLKMTNDVGSGL